MTIDRLRELYNRFHGRTLTSADIAALGGEAAIRNIDEQTFINNTILPSSEFQTRLQNLVREAYSLGLARGADPSGMATYTQMAAQLMAQGKSYNEALGLVIKNLFSSEEASIRGQIALEREYLDKYIRPTEEALARAELEPFYREKLQDQLTLLNRRLERAQADFHEMTLGFTASDALAEFDPSIPVGQLEAERRRLLQDYQKNVERLAQREKIEFRNMADALGQAGISFGGLAVRAQREQEQRIAQAREDIETAKRRGMEDLLRGFAQSQRRLTEETEDVGLKRSLAERDIEREISQQTKLAAERRLAMPAEQRRQRLLSLGAFGSEEEMRKALGDVSPFRV